MPPNQEPDVAVKRENVNGLWNCSLEATLHELIAEAEPLPPNFAHKLLLLHLGHNTGSSPLSAADFTEFFLALSKRFAAFANCMPQFRALSSEDRDSLLISNTPLYLQFHVAKYINATGNGRRQIEALVGPAGLVDSDNEEGTAADPVVSLTFSCFGESVGILKDALWTDVLTGNANRISKAGGVVEDHSSVGLAAATMLFYQDKAFPSDDLDDPSVVARSYETLRRQLVSCGFARSGRGVDAVMETLNSMAHIYAAHANFGGNQHC